MIAVLLTLAAAGGTWLLYTSLVLGWRGVGPPGARAQRPTQGWLASAGLGDVRLSEVVGVCAALFVVGVVVAYAVFGGVLPPLVTGSCLAVAPPASYRARRDRRRAEALDAWPRMIEEIRLLTGSLGRSVPQALLEVGRRGPEELRPAFEAAERAWRITTDAARMVEVLKQGLADPTADVVCETLLVAHEVGGTDLDGRLAALAEDRLADQIGRKDARAKQAGVRFARRFVLVVPAGMALVGLAIGTGRHAYATATGQILVTVGILSVAACWIWAGRLLRLPTEDRVFDDHRVARP